MKTEKLSSEPVTANGVNTVLPPVIINNIKFNKMGKECFTCSNKISTELTNEQRKEMKDEAIARGEKWPRIPEMMFHCKVTGNRISQIDPACEHYSGDNFMESVRKDIAKTAKKLREEMNS